MSANCVGSLQVCRLRVAQLTAGGLPDSGSDTGYISDAIIQANISVELESGDDFVLKNGCGNLCQTFKDSDRVKRVNIDMELCQLDSELVGLLVGADTFVDMSNNTLGAALPSSTDTPSNGVALELWTKAWDSNQQANASLIGGSSNDVLYFRWFFPFVRFQLGAMTLQNDILRIPVAGYGQENSDMPAEGPFQDFPTAVEAAGGIVTAGGWFLDDTMPEAQCGYISVPTVSS
jgi:hypothetical protein